jgi:hypothetical protein
MTISDAIPVQFWTADKETFNEKVLCIPKNECFCAPWNCDDEIIIQFQDTAAQNMELSIIDAEEQVLYTLEFDEIETGVYQLTITPSELEPPICNKQVQFKIHGASESVLDDQVTDITGWSNTGSGDKPWIVPSYQIQSNNFRGRFFENIWIAPSSWTDFESPWDSKTSDSFIVTLNNLTGDHFSYMPFTPPGSPVILFITLTVSGTFTGGAGFQIYYGEIDSQSTTGNTTYELLSGNPSDITIGSAVSVDPSGGTFLLKVTLEDTGGTDAIFLRNSGGPVVSGSALMTVKFENTTTQSATTQSGQSYEVLVDIDSGHSNKHLYVILSKSSGSGTQTIDMGSSLTSGVNSEFFTADDDYDQIELFVESTDAVQLRISEVTVREFDIDVSGGEVFVLENKTFNETLSPWVNVDNSGGRSWIYDEPFEAPFPTAAKVASGGGVIPNSDYLQQELSSPIPSGTDVAIEVTCFNTLAQSDLFLRVSFWDGSINQVIDTVLLHDESAPHTYVFEGTLSITATHIRIYGFHEDPFDIHLWDLFIGEVSDIYTDLVIGTTIPITPFNEWTNIDNDWYDWSVDSGDAVVLPGSSNSLKVFFTGEESSRFLRKAVSLSGGDIMNYSVQLASTGAAEARQVTATVEFLLAGEVVLSLDYNLSGSTSSLTQTIADEVVLPDDVDEIRVYGTSETDIFQSLEVTNFIINAAEILLKSDCLDIKESHPCTEVIEYSNNVDFDGIVYDTSPVPVFKLRVPALFYKEENPMEQEDLDLSNGEIVTLRQSIQEKRLLEVGYLPNYMHKKIQKILMHKTVTIDGQQWKRRDPYEAENIDKYSLKTGECWLTLYNSVERNTL